MPTGPPCVACATTLPASARFCSRCGEPQWPGLQRPQPLFKASGAPAVQDGSGADLQAKQGCLHAPLAGQQVQDLDRQVLAAHPYRSVPAGIESQLNA